MNSEYVQGLRYKLQKRVRRIRSSEVSTFHTNLTHLWLFLHSYSVFVGVLDQLRIRFPSVQDEVAKLSPHDGHIGDTEDEHAAFASYVVAHCAESDDHLREVQLARPYNRGENKHRELQLTFLEIFIEPLYEYIDEHLDDQRAILALLRRYKQKCEWFQRGFVRDLLETGERKLAYHLYEFLFDQGIDFSIEPTSTSGEADLIAAQRTRDPLIADIKIFDPTKSKDKRYILQGFHQVYIYTLDYNESFGYMVVFNNSGKDLAFPSVDTEQSIPCFTHNNKTIFVLIVDVFDYPTTASKRGRLETVVIAENELIWAAEE